MEETRYTLSEAAKLVGVHPKTLQRLDRKGVLNARRTLTNRRYYYMVDILEFKRMQVLEAKRILVDDILDAVGRYHGRVESQ